MSNAELIEEAESFAAGCSRSRLELRLVDALKAAEWEMQARELHHFEAEQELEELKANNDHTRGKANP